MREIVIAHLSLDFALRIVNLDIKGFADYNRNIS